MHQLKVDDGSTDRCADGQKSYINPYSSMRYASLKVILNRHLILYVETTTVRAKVQELSEPEASVYATNSLQVAVKLVGTSFCRHSSRLASHKRTEFLEAFTSSAIKTRTKTTGIRWNGTVGLVQDFVQISRRLASNKRNGFLRTSTVSVPSGNIIN